jgi:hypothetical protein
MFITAFEVAAPEIFGTALGAEFGTAAAFDALGAGELFGAGAGLFGEFGGSLAGQALGGAPLAETLSSGVAQGLGGAGQAGINEALVAQQQANAVQAANSGLFQNLSNVPLDTLDPSQIQQLTSNLSNYKDLGQVAETGLDTTKELIQNQPQGLEQVERFANTTNASFPQTSADPVQSAMNNPAAQPGAAMNAPYQSYNPVEEQLAQVPGGRLPPSMTGASAPLSEPSGLEAGFNKALNYVKENPFSAGSMGLNALQYANRKEKKGLGPTAEYNGPLSKYKMSSDFQGRQANPADYQYTPTVYNMAEGGIASYKKGDLVGESSMDYYTRMTKPMTPLSHGDVGIYYDQDPDTRYQDALTAAQIRMAKVNKRANMQLPGMKRPTPMGQLNLAPPGIKASESGSSLDPEMAAHGGIMRAHRYADGGVTGSGNLDLHIPLDLGGGGGGYGAGGGYPFQNSSGFTGYNNMFQATPPDQQANLGQAQAAQYQQTQTTQDQQGSTGPLALGFAGGGIMHGSLGSYADGGNPRLLKGPGDGMSDNIPATIAGKQPARLADGEFVIPADVVSHLGNGSTDAGAKILHEMMNKVRKARTGNPKQGKQINPNKFVPK